MISTVACNTDAEAAQIFAQYAGEALEGSYATAPMAAVLPAHQPPSDEELHSSFEEAISSRLSAVHTRLERLSSEPLAPYRSTGPLRAPSQPQTLPRLHRLQGNGRKLLTQLGLGLVLLLSGFDLMGLLVLHVR